MITIAIYPGTFDPFTNGHLDILSRISTLYDKVIIVIGENTSKTPFLSLDIRLKSIQEIAKRFSNVTAAYTNKLIVEYAKEQKATVIVRGIRDHNDYEKERELATINSSIAPKIETIFLLAKNDKQFISSTFVREMIKLNYDISPFVPAEVYKLI